MIIRITVANVALLVLSLCTSPAVAADVQPGLGPSAYLAQADSLLTEGKFSDALQFYDAAVAADPQNYLSLFKRGATYLSVGRTSPALSDFDKALELKPDFDSALVQRGKLRLRLGNWNGARADLEKVAANNQRDMIQQINVAEYAAASATSAEKKGDYAGCITQAETAIKHAPLLASLRALRARCRLHEGQVREASMDLLHVVKTNPLDADSHAMAAQLLFLYLDEREKAIQQLSKCLHYDPDSAVCKKYFRLFKKIDKEVTKSFTFRDKGMHATFDKTVVIGQGPDIEPLLTRIDNLSNEVQTSMHIPPSIPKLLDLDVREATCDVYYTLRRWSAGAHYCNEVLKYRPDSVPGALFTAKLRMNDDEFDRAIEILTKANDATGGQDARINAMLREAQVLQKRANTKDYYKVLGVSRDAAEKDIKKAYRNKTKEYHPDKYRGDLKPEQVERKMQEINEAYEVLSNPELRQRFDNGDDPNDHASQTQQHQQHRSGGFNPFFQQGSGGFGGFPGGGGGGGQQQQFFQQGGRTFYRSTSSNQQKGSGGSFKFHM
ncbi:uncharacterized protein V1518DRAFT_412712 [Limtongia smithiae]|uniref:uncharacterized protein n=1 Tax=Limtongia smithiae TaxID=1125753 RepID=UPI0034CD8F0F